MQLGGKVKGEDLEVHTLKTNIYQLIIYFILLSIDDLLTP